LNGDTIVALSSPPGTSGLAVVRLSGPACRFIIKTNLGRETCMARHVYYGAFRKTGTVPQTTSLSESDGVLKDASLNQEKHQVLDRLNFVFFPAPASSTGEDVLELYPHGNMLIVDGILKALLEHVHIRLAEPGEFTRRGFENGKIDLLQAEAIGELIQAESTEALKNAQRIVGGALRGPLNILRDQLLDLSARLELDVDFSEEEADPDYASWIPRVEAVQGALQKLSLSFEKGRGLSRARRVAILGAPNAGKSSLINALVNEDRLLVSDIPGTTRDYVEVPLRLPGGIIHLVDTAGLGRPVDGLDALAMQRTRQQWQQADVRVWIEDGTVDSEAGNQDARWPDLEADWDGQNSDSISLSVATKKDLPAFKDKTGFLSVSSRSGEGLAEFRDALDTLVFRNQGIGEDIVLTTERQFQAVAAAKTRVDAALAGLRKSPAIEIIAFEVREAVGHLKELVGEISTDEVLQKIFSGYCIGK
jgi:tRNA modification GTPase